MSPEAIQHALNHYGVRLVRRDGDLLMVLLAYVLGDPFLNNFWTTYRLPLCRPVIAYPRTIQKPEECHETLEHELFHVRDFAPWYGPIRMLLLAVLLPLPMYLSGRWFIERHAYLNDVRSKRMTAEQAVGILWTQYGRPWPRSLMLAWFKKQIGEA